MRRRVSGSPGDVLKKKRKDEGDRELTNSLRASPAPDPPPIAIFKPLSLPPPDPGVASVAYLRTEAGVRRREVVGKGVEVEEEEGTEARDELERRPAPTKESEGLEEEVKL